MLHQACLGYSIWNKEHNGKMRRDQVHGGVMRAPQRIQTVVLKTWVIEKTVRQWEVLCDPPWPSVSGHAARQQRKGGDYGSPPWLAALGMTSSRRSAKMKLSK